MGWLIWWHQWLDFVRMFVVLSMPVIHLQQPFNFSFHWLCLEALIIFAFCRVEYYLVPSTINFSSDFIFPRKIAIHFLPNINLNSANFSCKIVCSVKIATVTPGGLKSLLYIATICVLSCRECCGFPLSYLEFQIIHLYRYDPVGMASWIA